jgi:hypothetical protein
VRRVRYEAEGREAGAVAGHLHCEEPAVNPIRDESGRAPKREKPCVLLYSMLRTHHLFLPVETLVVLHG